MIQNKPLHIQFSIAFGLMVILFPNFIFAQSPEVFTTSGSWTAPACVNSIDVQVWGAGGAGGGEPNSLIAPPVAGGGGGGGAYSSATSIVVVSGVTYNFTVGTGGVGDDNDGQDGGSSSATFGATTITANGGKGGKTGSNGAGGAGGVAGPGGRSGGNGFAGEDSGILIAAGYGGGGGGGAGTSSDGANGTAGGNFGNGGTGNINGDGGQGGDPNVLNALFQTSGAPGTSYGGGGGGANSALIAVSGLAGNATGGNGANGAVIISYTIGAVATMTSSIAETICSGDNVNLALTASEGATFTWIANDNANTTGESTTVQSTSTITDVLVNADTLAQVVTYTVVPSATLGGCLGIPQIVSITVNPEPILSSTLTPDAICSGTTFTYTPTSDSPNPIMSWTRAAVPGISEAGGAGSGTGPISKTLTNLTIDAIDVTYVFTTSSNGCVGPPENVVVTVNAEDNITLFSALGTDAQNVCINSPIVDITYTVTGGATGVTVVGLPSGIIDNFVGGLVTLIGTPTVSGAFDYTITTTGACFSDNIEGKITVGAALTSLAGTDSQAVCKDSPIIDIVYSVAGATPGATVAGLPAGVTGNFSGSSFTISGTPTVEGAWNYSVFTTSSCPSDTVTGIITVGAGVVIQNTDTQTVCNNTPIQNIDYTIVGGDSPPPTVSNLPPGVSGTITSPGIFTISGTPTSEGTYEYSIITNGSCSSQSTIRGRITVGLGLVSAPGTDSQSVCNGNPIVDINYAFAGGDVPAPTISNLPAGITGVVSSPGIFTISGSSTVDGQFDYTLTTNGSCATPSSLNGRITIGAGLNVAGLDTQRVCKNAPISDIVYTYAGGNIPPPTVTGLPAGVTGSITGSNEFTISGTPTAEGAFNYTVLTQGTCSSATSLSGLIIVGLGLDILGRDTQSVCKGAPIVNIDYIIIGGDTPPPTVTGLPTGVTGAISSPGVFTLSGTPSSEGLFIYTVTTDTTGGCPVESKLSGSIAVGMQLLSAVGTDSQNVCNSAPIIDIVYAFAGGDVPPPTITGAFPTGVTGSVSSPGLFTITGIPTVEGFFTYTLTTNGSCPQQSSLSGSINVGAGLSLVSVNDTQKVCKNAPIVDIVYNFAAGSNLSITGLPTGVTGAISSPGVFTITGTPSLEGQHVYSLSASGICPTTSILKGIITVGVGLINPGTDTQSICEGDSIVDIDYTIVGGDVPPPTVIGLPAGLVGLFESPGIFTISGIPAVEGKYSYTITTDTTGSCADVSNLTGSITIGLGLNVSGTDTQKVCKNDPITDIVFTFIGNTPPTVVGLPGGISSTVTAPGEITISGIASTEGLYPFTVTTDTTGACPIESSLNGEITIGLGLKSVGTDTQSICKTDPIVNIVYTFVGDSVPTVTGLPAGLSGSQTGIDEFTISGTPTQEGRFYYTVTTMGTCASQSSLSGMITIGLGVLVPGADTQSVCKGDPITDIDYVIIGGDLPAPTIAGLPTGVTGSISSAGIYTITGTPTTEGLFTYTITTSGSCAVQSTLVGNIAVGMQILSAVGTDSQRVCKAEPLVNIVYAFAGGNTPPPVLAGALPAGITNGITSPGIYTISGTPTEEGAFNYTLTSSGSCSVSSSLSGRILVGLGTNVPGLDSQRVCKNEAIVDIVYTIIGGTVPAPIVSGLPSGVSGAVTGADLYTISGIPTEEGRFNFTLSTNGTCGTQSTLGGDLVVGLGLKVPGTDVQTVCKNDPIVAIDYDIVDGDIPAPSVAGLPAGLSQATSSAGVYTISGTPTEDGVFTYTISANGTCATKSSLTGTITVNTTEISLASNIRSKDQVICFNDEIKEVVFSINGTPTDAILTGSPAGLTGVYNAGAFTITGTLEDAPIGTYTYTVTPVGPCSQGPETFSISIIKPEARFEIDEDSGAPPLEVKFFNTSLNATTYNWIFGDGNTDTSMNSSKNSYVERGKYNAQLVASYDSQCPDTAEAVEIIVYDFQVPTVFTPNGDGVNDLFVINSLGIKTLNVEIYNRWGLKMAEWKTTGASWDGYNLATGIDSPPGTYFYVITATDVDKRSYSEHGSFLLIR